MAHDAVIVGVSVHGTHLRARMRKFGIDVVEERLRLDVLHGIDLRLGEGGAETEFVGTFVLRELFPHGLVLERGRLVHHEAHDGVSALLDVLDHERVEVVVRTDAREQRVPGFGGIHRVEDADGLVRLLLAEVRVLEQNIEADRGCASVT